MLRVGLVVLVVRVPEPGWRNAHEPVWLNGARAGGVHVPCGPPGPEAAVVGWRGMCVYGGSYRGWWFGVGMGISAIPGLVTVSGKGSDDLAPGTLNSIRKQAGLKN